MAAIWEHYLIVTLYDGINSGCGPQRKHFRTYYPLSKFRSHGFNILGVEEGEESTPSGPGRLKKTRCE